VEDLADRGMLGEAAKSAEKHRDTHVEESLVPHTSPQTGLGVPEPDTGQGDALEGVSAGEGVPEHPSPSGREGGGDGGGKGEGVWDDEGFVAVTKRSGRRRREVVVGVEAEGPGGGRGASRQSAERFQASPNLPHRPRPREGGEGEEGVEGVAATPGADGGVEQCWAGWDSASVPAEIEEEVCCPISQVSSADPLSRSACAF